MSNTIIAAISSERRTDALFLSSMLADKLDAELVLVHVAPDHTRGDDVHDVLAATRALLDRRSRVETELAIDASPAHALYELAAKHDADLIVLGPPRHVLAGHTGIGPVTERLLHGSPCPVALAPSGYAARPAHDLAVVGVGVDDGPDAQEALRFAQTLAASAGSRLRLWTAIGAGHADSQPRRDLADRCLTRLLEPLPHALGATGEVLDGDAGAAVVRAAEIDGADLLVCGSRGYGPIRSVLLGSVSAQFARHATCPVVVVPRGVTELPVGSSAAGLAAAANWP